MQLFLDTASIDDVRAAARYGVISGVTTNPSLLAKEGGVSYRQRIQEIAAVIDGPISAECISRTADELVAEARELASWHPNVVVKIPIDAEGLEAIHRCSKEGIRVNVTLIFSANQALLAALPEPDPELTRQKAKLLLRSLDIPSLANLPAGCPFHPRCLHFVAGLCDVERPLLDAVDGQRAVACHIVQQERTRSDALQSRMEVPPSDNDECLSLERG
jgi:oligopeptide/dipeptide ABC transporter ATP-binding protein